MSKSRHLRLFGEFGVKIFYKNGSIAYHSVIGEETKSSKTFSVASVSEIDEIIHFVSESIRNKMNDASFKKSFGALIVKVRFRNGVPVFLTITFEETFSLDKKKGTRDEEK